MGYSEDPCMVRVDFFQSSGKWYCTEAVKWTEYTGLIHECFEKALALHFEGKSRFVGMTAICLEPYHEHSHPISLVVRDYSKASKET